MSNNVINQFRIYGITHDIKPYLGSAVSGDSSSPTEFESVNTITNSDTYDTVFNKVTKMVKNVRYLYSKLGTTDFSGVGSTTSAAIVNLNNGKSDTTHNHDSVYAAKSHTHSEYSLTTHTHSQYSTTGHTHSNYASSTHNHDTAYAAKTHSHSEYSTTGHTHSNYSTTGHTHSNYSTTGHTHSTYIATSSIAQSYSSSTTTVPCSYLVNELKTSVSNGKSAIASAITDKGISTSSSDTFSTMASNIGKLKPSSAVNISITTVSQASQNKYISFTTSYNPTNFICVARANGVSVGGSACNAGMASINGTNYCSEIKINGTLLSSNGIQITTSYANGSFKITPRNSSSNAYLVPGTWILVYW